MSYSITLCLPTCPPRFKLGDDLATGREVTLSDAYDHSISHFINNTSTPTSQSNQQRDWILFRSYLQTFQDTISAPWG